MPDRRLLAWMGIAALCCLPLPASANDDQTALQKNLKSTLKAMDSTAKEQEKLAARREAMGKELGALQKDLVGIAATLQSREKQLSSLEEETAGLVERETALSQDLKAREKEMDRLLMSMMKLSIVPPEMALAMPGDMHETQRTAKVLGLTSAAIREKALTLQSQLQEVQSLRSEIDSKRAEMQTEQSQLQTNQQKLEAKLAERSKLQDTLASQQESRAEELKKLAENSESLKKLLADLEQRKKEEAAAAKARAERLALEAEQEKAESPIRKGRSTTPKTPGEERMAKSAAGISLPAEGRLISAYGEKEEGETSRGIRIRTRAGAAVTAPQAGEVVYTGPFLDYGNLIIIRHNGKIHSLLAGLSSIQSKPGQKVVKGEPVGKMGDSDKGTALYVEIRKDNKPVDPLPWLKSSQIASR